LTQRSGQTFTITPIAGYEVANVFVDNNPIGATTTYTFNGVAGNHSISAVFAPVGTPVTVITPVVTPTTPNENGVPPVTTPTAPSINNSVVSPTAPVAAPTSTNITGNEVSATPTATPTPSATPTVTIERNGEWMLWALIALLVILSLGGLFIFFVYRRRKKQEEKFPDKETWR
jgi:hypothetical protein